MDTATRSARFFVPKLPVIPGQRRRWALADWHQWVVTLKAFATLRHVEPIGGRCRIVARVNRPCVAGASPISPATREGWREGIRRGLIEARLIADPEADVTLARVDDLPSWSAEGGVEIEIIPLDMRGGPNHDEASRHLRGPGRTVRPGRSQDAAAGRAATQLRDGADGDESAR